MNFQAMERELGFFTLRNQCMEVSSINQILRKKLNPLQWNTFTKGRLVIKTLMANANSVFIVIKRVFIHLETHTLRVTL
jgi:hypothetical protein